MNFLKKCIPLLHTLLVRFLLCVLVIIMLPFFLIVALYNKQKRFASPFIFNTLNVFYNISLQCLIVPITFKEKQRLPKVPSIIIANHQSAIDIPLIGALLKGHQHIWLARKELMNTFLLRWILPLFAHIIDTHNARTTAITFRNVIDLAEKTNAHIIIFPEGSRSLDGNLQHFFDGFLFLAKKLNRPIVPLFIHNIGKVYSRTSFLIRHIPVTVTVGKSFYIDEYENEKELKNSIIQYIHTLFQQE